MHHQKGVYFDGHNRSDVVEYRTSFLNELDKKSLTCDGNTQEGKRPIIRVAHDESTLYANCDQTYMYFWGDDESNVLRQKSLGQSIMVSDFVNEVNRYVRDGNNMACLALEISKDDYFTNEHLLHQVEKTINIFEQVHPQASALFLFENAPSHRKMASDALRVEKVNVGLEANNQS